MNKLNSHGKERYRQTGRIIQKSATATSCTALLIGLMLIAGCANHPPELAGETPDLIYFNTDTAKLLGRYAPIVAPQSTGHDYNRIGLPSARLDQHSREKIFVDPKRAIYYGQQVSFRTPHGRYTNLVYRIHFKGIPFRLIPFNLTSGKNTGLLIIVTINQHNDPVLVTTVHTCGCFLAIVPTSYLPGTAYPEKWDIHQQTVFGEHLPGQLKFPDRFDHRFRPLIRLRHQTHRVMDISIIDRSTIIDNSNAVPVEIAPMKALKNVPLDGRTTSFFHERGFRQGYVKGSFKPFELLLMSWWTLDLNVGVDKDFGDHRQTGTVFYTSLRPWQRSASNMWNFADFLHFWGWRL